MKMKQLSIYDKKHKLQWTVNLLILLGKLHIHKAKFLRSCPSFESFRSEFKKYFESVQIINNKTCAHTVKMLQEVFQRNVIYGQIILSCLYYFLNVFIHYGCYFISILIIIILLYICHLPICFLFCLLSFSIKNKQTNKKKPVIAFPTSTTRWQYYYKI